MRGMQAIERVVQYDDIDTVLDIGSWNGDHANYLRRHGKTVSTVDFNVQADYHGNYLDLDLPKFDCIWCSHTLEHQTNVGKFLKKCFKDLNDNGLLAVTVPSMEKYGTKVVDGHMTYWNAGVLLYNIILAGFDCHDARVATYNNEVSVLVRKVKADLPRISSDRGEIQRLSRFFPIGVSQGFDGSINKVNW
jgi:SAM-dependent methyltransferase